MMAPPGAPRPNPLQRLWLREIGIEKTWLGREEDAPVAAKAGGNVPVSEGDGGRTAPSGSEPPTLQGGDGGRRVGGSAPTGPVRPPSPPATEFPRSPERDAAIARADLETLHGMASACAACGLCKGRRNAVFGMGPSAPRWMVVGEAPGEQEDRQGLPFVGRSGQLLDAMLAAVGMSRAESVFIANVIKCRPPGNRNPTPEEIAACSPFLMRQIELLEPERILVLGRFAAQTLLGTDATIGSLRGRAHTIRVAGREIPVVVSYHPAYLLRSPAEKAKSWQDLRLAASL